MSRQTWALLAKRNAARRALTEKVEVWRATQTTDGMGGVTEVLARVATWPGKVDPVSERAVVIAERMGASATATISLPHDANPQPGDQFRVHGITYAFIGADVGTTNATVVKVVVGSLH